MDILKGRYNRQNPVIEVINNIIPITVKIILRIPPNQKNAKISIKDEIISLMNLSM